MWLSTGPCKNTVDCKREEPQNNNLRESNSQDTIPAKTDKNRPSIEKDKTWEKQKQ